MRNYNLVLIFSLVFIFIATLFLLIKIDLEKDNLKQKEIQGKPKVFIELKNK